MTSQAIPQTRTVMEAGFTLREGIEEQFWRANNAAVPTAAAQPGFVAVTGGPHANSSWRFFLAPLGTPGQDGRGVREEPPQADAGCRVLEVVRENVHPQMASSGRWGSAGGADLLPDRHPPPGPPRRRGRGRSGQVADGGARRSRRAG